MRQLALRTRLAAFLSIASLLVPSLAQAAGYLYVTNGSDDTVSVFNTFTHNLVDTIDVGAAPIGIAISGTGAYVVNSAGDTVSVIDVTDNEIVTTIAVGDFPRGVFTNGTGAYVTNVIDDTVSVIDTTTLTVERTIDVGEEPREVAFSGTGAYVTNYFSDSVTVIDITDFQVVTTVSVGDQVQGIAVSGTGAYVANGGSNTISIIDITDNQVDATISVANYPLDIAISGTGIYVTRNSTAAISVFDTTDNQLVREITGLGGGFEAGTYGITISGTGAFVTNNGLDVVYVIDTTTLSLDDTLSTGGSPRFAAVYEDSTTLDPTLTAPTTGSSVELCNDLTVTYTLPETPLADSVKIQFYNTGTHGGPTLTLSGSMTASFALDLENLTSAEHVSSTDGDNALVAGSYVMYVKYRDQFGNAEADDDANLTVTACASSSSSSSASSSSSSSISNPGGGGRRGSPGRCEGEQCMQYPPMHGAASTSSSSSSSQSSAAPKSVTEEICDAVQDVSSFKDVRDNSWFSCYSKNVAGLKIFEGYKETDGTPKNEFGPSDNITLGQLAKVGTILRNKEDLSPKPMGDKWYEPYIGAVQAYDAAVFVSSLDPLKSATRAEVIHTILEALQIPMESGESPYDDVSEKTSFSSAIITATKLGFVSGDDSGTDFRPNDPVNRAEVAKMLSLALAHVGIIYGDEMPDEQASSSFVSISSVESSSSVASSDSSESSDSSSVSSEASESSSESSEASESSSSSSESSVALMTCRNLLPRHLMLRAAPNLSAEIIGSLAPHQSDLCTASKAGWVELIGGNAGPGRYVERNGAISVTPMN